MIFAGSGSVQLADRICEYLGVKRGDNETRHFSDGNVFVRVKENVRGRQVYLVQSTVFPANDNFMELLFWIDALKRASAESVTAVIPYFRKTNLGFPSERGSARIQSRLLAQIVLSPWTSTRLRFKAFFTFRSIICTQCLYYVTE
jgi:ribose-phosphate pyrophosphokinase